MGKLSGDIILIAERNGLDPADEESRHFIAHCWCGPVPIPLDQEDDFKERARRQGNVVSVFPSRVRRGGLFVSLFGRGR